ncbi:MBOAT family O-acyltransferase [Aliarcobacter lanthieri]|uniref:MBOAT family O-acyltransferase n=2 Tax=Aliarcobacter lanthieri TaxID=1355374 RepID=UPI0004A6E747|nr:MBOAT family protein [Aliarcobacter lanthieri]
MLFNSYEFIFAFLPLVFIIYFYLMHKRLVVGAKAFLVFSSLFFYSWWNILYLPIILSSVLFNYVIGNILSTKEFNKSFSKKSVLIFGILVNLSLLGYFKYADFFIDNFNVISGSSINLLHLALPLALSFVTFQQIAFLVDSYKGYTKENDFINYSLFITFFPQLIAGPIVHHKEMMPQFASKYNFVKNYKNIALGLFIFSIGLFKKVVIADTFSIWANAGFDSATTLNLIEAWATSLSYTFQLYFDFSGYTDMAIGLALLFNIKLPINFNSPYKALSIQDFWRRWHITLSRFLRDYIYIPLGGNRKGSFRTYSNLIATFVIGGLWHGAGWTFIFWGLLHGVALAIHRVWQSLGYRMNTIIAWFITFNFVNIAWVFFRAKSWDDAIKVLSSMFSLNNIVLPEKYFKFISEYNNIYFKFGEVYDNILGKNNTTVFIIAGFLITLFLKNSMEKRDTFKANYFNLCICFGFMLYSIFQLNKISEFLYFNF